MISQAVRRNHKVGVNLAATGTTTLFTPPREFLPTLIIVDCTAATAVIGVASFSLGTNGTDINDILGITALTALSVAGLYKVIPIVLGTGVAAGTAVKLKVTTAITGTSQVADIHVIGVEP